MSYRPSCARLALTLTLLPLAGCPERELAKVPIRADVVENVNIPLDDNRDVDILFVIDNSLSMEAEQDSLAANFPLIIDRLRASAIQPSVHLGVISTDVGGGELCGGTGDTGTLLTGASDCNAINNGGNFLSDIVNADGTRSTNYDGDLRDAFSCMARLGTDGCGFEQPLEAVKQAIDNPANEAFFRDGAYLAIIFITDEDDCSVSGPELLRDSGDRSPAALESQLGPESSFRCFEFGVKCDETGGPREDGVRNNCIPREDSEFMNSVASYIEHVRGSKRFPTQIFTAAIAGELSPVAVEHRDSMRFPFAIPQLAYSCDSALGEAVPPVRLAAFLGAFQGPDSPTSICRDDLAESVREIADLFDFVGPGCLEGSLVDASDEPGLQPDCSVTEVVNPDIEGEVETVLRECNNAADPKSSSVTPCYVIYDEPECANEVTGLAVEVVYAEGYTVPPFTRAEVSCVGIAPI